MTKLREKRVTKTRGRKARVFFGEPWRAKHDCIIGYIVENPGCILHDIVSGTGFSLGAVYEHTLIAISAGEVERKQAEKSVVTTGKNTIWRYTVVQVMDYKTGPALYDANGRPRGIVEENRPVARGPRKNPEGHPAV